MIYQKLGIDPFHDVIDHDPKDLEEEVAKMNFIELLKEFYDQEKLDLEAFTKRCYLELDRREKIGLVLRA